MFDLKENELIVFIITNGEDDYIINTTERFLNVNKKKCEEVLYTDFEKIGLNITASVTILKKLRIPPKYKNCFLIKRNGEVLIWKILYDAINPFIQSTKRCGFIGKKYNLIKTGCNNI